LRGRVAADGADKYSKRPGHRLCSTKHRISRVSPDHRTLSRAVSRPTHGMSLDRRRISAIISLTQGR
jgi:hypothetical protein